MQKRILSFDTLRGFAIIIMFIDHFYAISESMDIKPFNIRFFTRIAEPLFVLIFAYFLFKRDEKSLLMRGIEIVLTALFVNLFFFSVLGKLEILVSFLIIYILYALFKEWLWLGGFVLLLFKFDITRNFLDYPISIVLYQVALMFAYKKKLLWVPLLLGLYMFFISPPYNYVILFTYIALAFILIAERTSFNIKLLNYIGQRPLTFYIIQYVLAIFLALLIN